VCRDLTDLSLDPKRGEKRISKYLITFENGGGLRFRRGGATTGHHAGIFISPEKITWRRRCVFVCNVKEEKQEAFHASVSRFPFNNPCLSIFIMCMPVYHIIMLPLCPGLVINQVAPEASLLGLGLCFFADLFFALIFAILVLIIASYTSCVSSFHDKIPRKLLLFFDAFLRFLDNSCMLNLG
jgi:hypothetical protein